MSEITNPPLEPGVGRALDAAGTPPVGEEITNPPLDGRDAAPSSAEEIENPPLEGRSRADSGPLENPSLTSITEGSEPDGMNPPLDEADIEQWFEERLEAGPTPTGSPVGEQPDANKAAPKKETTTEKPTGKGTTSKSTKSK